MEDELRPPGAMTSLSTPKSETSPRLPSSGPPSDVTRSETTPTRLPRTTDLSDVPQVNSEGNSSPRWGYEGLRALDPSWRDSAHQRLESCLTGFQIPSTEPALGGGGLRELSRSAAASRAASRSETPTTPTTRRRASDVLTSVSGNHNLDTSFDTGGWRELIAQERREREASISLLREDLHQQETFLDARAKRVGERLVATLLEQAKLEREDTVQQLVSEIDSRLERAAERPLEAAQTRFKVLHEKTIADLKADVAARLAEIEEGPVAAVLDRERNERAASLAVLQDQLDVKLAQAADKHHADTRQHIESRLGEMDGMAAAPMVEALKKDMDARFHQISALLERNSQVTGVLEQSSQDLSMLQVAVVQLQREREGWESSLAVVRNDCTRLREELEARLGSANEAVAQLHRHREAIAQLQRDKEANEDKVLSIRNEIAHLREMIDHKQGGGTTHFELQRERDAMQREREEWGVTLANLRGDMAKLSQAQETAAASQLKSERETWEASLAAMRAELTKEFAKVAETNKKPAAAPRSASLPPGSRGFLPPTAGKDLKSPADQHDSPELVGGADDEVGPGGGKMEVQFDRLRQDMMNSLQVLKLQMAQVESVSSGLDMDVKLLKEGALQTGPLDDPVSKATTKAVPPLDSSNHNSLNDVLSHMGGNQPKKGMTRKDSKSVVFEDLVAEGKSPMPSSSDLARQTLPSSMPHPSPPPSQQQLPIPGSYGQLPHTAPHIPHTGPNLPNPPFSSYSHLPSPMGSLPPQLPRTGPLPPLPPGGFPGSMPSTGPLAPLSLPGSAPGSSPGSARGAPLDLRECLLRSRVGENVEHPASYKAEHDGQLWYLLHKNSGVRVWPSPLQLSSPSDGDILLYYYCDRECFTEICEAAEVLGTLLEQALQANAIFGSGVYMTYYAPDHFGSKAAVLINFYSNASDRGTQMRNIDDYFGRADYCIPFMVGRSSAVNVMQQATPEMTLGAGYSVSGEYIRPDRDIWVVTIDPVEEAIKQLMDPSPSARAQAARSLRELATKADNRAVAALLPRLGAERDMAVKAAVAGALGEVVQRGDNRACLALQRCLEASNIASHVREAAALALGKVAEKGDRGTVDALARCLDADSEPTVRASAAYALGRVAAKDDVRAIEALSYRFGDEEEDEKVSAVAGQALKRMGMDVDVEEEGSNCVLT